MINCECDTSALYQFMRRYEFVTVAFCFNSAKPLDYTGSTVYRVLHNGTVSQKGLLMGLSNAWLNWIKIKFIQSFKTTYRYVLRLWNFIKWFAGTLAFILTPFATHNFLYLHVTIVAKCKTINKDLLYRLSWFFLTL